MEYEYTINMIWNNTDENNKNESFTIEPQSINQLTMFNDYENTNMPVIYATLSMDKKYFDKIIAGSKTACIYLNIFKLYTLEDTGIEIKQLTQYSGKMSYFINQDINYNKEIDYSGANSTKKDVLQTFSIGLMFANCIEANKQTNNTNFVGVPMQNQARYFLQQEIPLLIEPFDYNESLKQLVIPPMDSLSKTINYLNDTRVFYKTPYRFYIEPDCMYLMSTSGNGVRRKDEKYNTVLLHIRGLDEKEALNGGMDIDNKYGCYTIDVNVKYSWYTIDSDTQKLFNQIESIIDPSITESATFINNINTSISKVTGLVHKIESTITDSTKIIKNTINSLPEYKATVVSAVKNIDGVLNLSDNLRTAIAQGLYGITSYDGLEYLSIYSVNERFDHAIKEIEFLKKLYYYTEVTTTSEDGSTTSSSGVKNDKVVSDEECDEMIKKLKEYKSSANNCNTIGLGIPNILIQSMTILSDICSTTANITTFTSAVSLINISTNTYGMLQEIINTKNKVTANTDNINNTIIPKVNTEYRMSGYLKAAISVVSKASEYYRLWMTGTALTVDPYASTIKIVDGQKINPFSDIIDDMNNGSNIIEKEADAMLIAVEHYKVNNLSVESIISAVQPTIQSLNKECKENVSNTVNQLKTNYQNILNTANTLWETVTTLGSTAKEQLSEMAKTAKEATVKLNSLDFNINSLSDLQKDLNAFKDLSHIGMLGISLFKANLNIAGPNSINTGSKIIRITNDNTNAIKNIKADIENHMNQLSITKEGLDTSVLTPNKQYIINNYDAHSGINGYFILNKKNDIFIRHDETKFTISTQLELSQVILNDSKNNIPTIIKDLIIH